MSENEISLKVLEAYTRDVGRGVARIDYDSMDTLNASTGMLLKLRVSAEPLQNVCHFIHQMRERVLSE